MEIDNLEKRQETDPIGFEINNISDDSIAGFDSGNESDKQSLNDVIRDSHKEDQDHLRQKLEISKEFREGYHKGKKEVIDVMN